MKEPKPQFDTSRPLSWSALSCFDNPDYPEYSDPEKWYQRYVLKIQEKPTPQLLFGSKVDKQIQNDPTFLPDLERYPIMQHTMNPTYKNIKLIGYADQWDEGDGRSFRLADDKTGVKPWDQKRADQTGQFTMYVTMLYLMEGIDPKQIECAIRWLPTMQNADMSIHFAKPFKIQTFKTKRSMSDVLKFLAYIEKTREAMIDYAKNHK